MDEDKLRYQALLDILGKTLNEAQQIFQQKYPKFTIRCVCKDGQFCVKHQYEPLNWNRLSIGIEKGIIVDKYNFCKDHNGYLNCCAAYWG
jgi:hypothetical protein